MRIHVAPPSVLPFINIKLAAYHLLLYVVYLCQKSQNFVYALICYKQKCKVVSLNLAHLVGLLDLLISTAVLCGVYIYIDTDSSYTLNENEKRVG